MNINIEFKTLGGELCWYTVKSKNNWKLQENILTGHYRILNNNIRIAWSWIFDDINHYFDSLFPKSSESNMFSELESLIKKCKNYNRLDDM